MAHPLRKALNVPGICDSACLRKLEVLLSQSFVLKVEDQIPNHMVFKAALKRTGLPKDVHIEIFKNENTETKTSPDVTTFLQDVWPEIERILRESVDIVGKHDADTIRIRRAEKILDYVRELPENKGVRRMVIVTLCDIILDLLVTEKLSRFTHRRQDLESESIGAKLEMLESKIPVYRSKAIRDIRDLRNRVAHGGDATVVDEARLARKSTIDIFNTF
jgi:hypothetical protein